MIQESLSSERILVIADAAPAGGSADFLELMLATLHSHGHQLDLALAETSFRRLVSANKEQFELAGVLVGNASSLLPEVSATISTISSRIGRAVLYLIESLVISSRINRLSERYRHVIVSTSYPGRFTALHLRYAKTTYFFHSYPVGKLHRLAGLFFGRLLDPRSTLVFVSRSLQQAYSKVWRLSSGIRQRVVWTTKGTQPYCDLTRLPESNSDTLRVLTVGAITADKGADLWVEVIQNLLSRPNMKKLTFTWLGDGSLRGELAKSLADKGLEEIGYLPGYVDDVDTFYGSAHMLLHLSRRESLGLAVVNALRHGLPVVAIETGGISEIVQNGTSGILVREASVEELADAIAALASNPPEIYRLGFGGRNFYSTELSQSIWEKKIIEAIFEKNS